ncbi:DUF4247 domain-containing protein [Streptomyces sp. ACA25]|uniref:DUF4247 domain-containing protein n=1 Tax=Streptomyces sp. ACA25 TaxID=3022596 RepID=UPI0023081F56|nr:DUF4247 domain-containing protein [Streptomyces sp. ACA25]MDB1090187.1 DUF4247 domain-containing protein [Streptomyces sp. ACA25]
MKRWTLTLTALLSAVLLVGCSSSGGQVPRSWIADTYERSGSAYLGEGTPAVVAGQIADHRKPRSRRSSGGNVYLRYRDHIVQVSPDHLSGARKSRIEIETYARGHQRWNTHVGSYWPAPSYGGGGGSGGSGFRGGGPGSGK